MKAIRLLSICFVFTIASPNLAFSAAVTCDEFANCGENCGDEDVHLGVVVGSVESIGSLLSFVLDEKGPCFGRITSEGGSGEDFDGFFRELTRLIDECAGSPAGQRSLSGVAFEAATNYCGSQGPSFARTKGILEQQCATCHISGSSGGFNMANGIDDLVGVPSNQSSLDYVSKGDPESSYLYRKIAGTHAAVGGGSVMPLTGMLSEDDIEAVAAWIRGGANP